MDEFGVLVESIGLRSQGKSTPLAELKPKPKSQFAAHGSANTPAFDNSYSLPVDELDGIFRSNSNPRRTQQPQDFLGGGDDFFGGPVSSFHQSGEVDLESVFSSSSNRKSSGNNSNSRNTVGFNDVDDLLGSQAGPRDHVDELLRSNAKQGDHFDGLLGSNANQGDHVDDLFGTFRSNSYRKGEGRGTGLDDLIPGFGGDDPAKTKGNSETNGRPANSSSTFVDDPFLVFESSVSQPDTSWPYGAPSDRGKGKVSSQSSFDEFDEFIMAGGASGSTMDGGKASSNRPSSGTDSNAFGSTNYVDDIFGGGNGVQQNNAARPSPVVQDSLFGDFMHEEKGTEVNQRSSSSFNTKKATSGATNVGIDFTSLFGDVTTSSGQFQEIEGEPEERRRARLNRHIRTNARMAEALAEKNQRDLQSQHEQEQKRRLAQTLHNDIQRWATGKEGNLRALLSSLQEVLWPECGWRPVSLTDMITSDSVKKVYKKATLCVHPDKVQQKGATIEQKYIAEKVFDILKEAWNKFSKEELR
ncbi:auxilin-related protein 2 [Andrographis paniculata]|uniref:auxilin-related protein 2 n=1 Tax=Andrographis paniculata TaxID=175694 RepID=UPI0021E88200|nr:auxilin-related protein 2 [Andrographis paniculata]